MWVTFSTYHTLSQTSISTKSNFLSIKFSVEKVQQKIDVDFDFAKHAYNTSPFVLHLKENNCWTKKKKKCCSVNLKVLNLKQVLDVQFHMLQTDSHEFCMDGKNSVATGCKLELIHINLFCCRGNKNIIFMNYQNILKVRFWQPLYWNKNSFLVQLGSCVTNSLFECFSTEIFLGFARVWIIMKLHSFLGSSSLWKKSIYNQFSNESKCRITCWRLNKHCLM